MDADDVVLGFLIPPEAGKNGVPLKSLFGFERVHVKAGETVQVFLYPDLTHFSQVDRDGNLYVHEGEYQIEFGLEKTLEHGMGYIHAGTLVAAL